MGTGEAYSMRKDIRIKWLEDRPALPAGLTWGVPWAEGELRRGEPVRLSDPSGEQEGLQTWATAYWPDGSVKWTAHAAVFSQSSQPEYFISKGEAIVPQKALTVEKKEDHVEVNTGKLVCRLGCAGTRIIEALYKNGRKLCSEGRLVCIKAQEEEQKGYKMIRQENYAGNIEKTTVEQQGPLRAVIKMEGRHLSLAGGSPFLPFILRFYFYADTDSVMIKHTFIYDGDAHRDFIQGLGFSFSVPLTGRSYNRQVRFAGDTGLFCEAGQFLSPHFEKYRELYPEQVDGNILGAEKTHPQEAGDMVQDMAVWDSFKIIQDSADHYVIRKRTKEGCCWIDADQGQRSGGLAYVGGEDGGLAAGIRNFREKFPASVEVHRLTQEEASLHVWLWSPDAHAMDLRHYDTETHMLSSYEGFRELRSTPYGIANTGEIRLFCFDRAPGHDTLLACTEESRHPSLLVCAPEHYHAVEAFGVWSLPDRGTPLKARLEDNLDRLIEFYGEEIEQRKWYGFWHYGDIMHTYDPKRHTWRYDMGGYAWANNELVPGMWFWYMFLRSGRADVFRMAEAMTRHNSETDVYHLGEYAGLGSRHNVVHWGCGCKEARISMAGLHRYYYYLTADERTGDILYEVRDADYAAARLDPMRDYFPKDAYPTHIRSGPDWSAFCSNWLTMWERFEDPSYRDKIREGIACLKNMPFRLCSGPTFGYDPDTGELHYLGDENYQYHMAVCFGSAEVWMELARLIRDPGWENALAEFGAFYNLSNEEKAQRTGGGIAGRAKSWGFPMVSARLAAFAARQTKDASLAGIAWKLLLDDPKGRTAKLPVEITPVELPGCSKPIREIPWITTNVASQWALNVIECLELIGDALPEKTEDIAAKPE